MGEKEKLAIITIGTIEKHKCLGVGKKKKTDIVKYSKLKLVLGEILFIYKLLDTRHI